MIKLDNHYATGIFIHSTQKLQTIRVLQVAENVHWAVGTVQCSPFAFARIAKELQILYWGPAASLVQKMRRVAAGVNADECNEQTLASRDEAGAT